MRSKERLGSWALTAPTALAVLIMAIYPLIFTVALALSQSSLGRPFQDWVGWENFANALRDPVVIDSLGRSILFTFLTTVVCVVLGVAIALLLQAKVRESRTLQTLVLLPMLTAPIAAGIAWRLILNPGGPVNGILLKLGIIEAPISFFAESPWAFITLVVADIWQWTPLITLLVYAALKNIPGSVYEASAIDGAPAWKQLRLVTLPMIVPGIVAAALLKTILGFRLFDLVYIVTRGGPGLDTTTSTYLIYRTALESFDIGAAAAQTVIFIVVVVALTLPIIKLRSWAEGRV